MPGAHASLASGLTIALAALAGLLAGRLAAIAAAWLPAYDPPRRWPALRCPHGVSRLRLADLVPLTGRPPGCPECAALPGAGGRLPELLTAAVCVLLALRFGPQPALVAFGYLGAAGVALAVIDARWQRLPDALTLPSYPAGLALLGIAAATSPGGGRRYLIALAGLAATWLFFALQALVYPAGIGWGDVKLSGVLGLYLGWLGADPLITGVFAGYLLAAVAGAALLISHRAGRRSRIPLGPFLLAGTLAAILAARAGS